jgi:hypothetical protein
MKSTLLAFSAILLGCSVDPYGTSPPINHPDAQVALPTPDTSPIQTDTQSSPVTVTTTDTKTASVTVTTTSVTTKTDTTPDAGTPDSLPPAQSTPDALVQVTQPDALPMAQDTLPAAQDTLPQTTPDTQPAQQPDTQPMAVDTKPATPDTLILADTKPATPDVLPVIDTKPAEDSKPATPDTQPAGGDTVAACGGNNQACCTTQAVDKPGYWIHTCLGSVSNTYDCNIEASVGTVPGPSGTCLTCGYKGYPGCTGLNLGMFSWKIADAPGGTCIHDNWQTPVCTGDICLCP